MKQIYFSKEDMLEIYQDGDNYILKYPTFNVTQPEVEKEIPKEAVDSYLAGDHTAKELIFFAETGRWQPALSQEEVNIKFLQENPEFLLIDTESKRHYFSEEEFNKLLKKAHEIAGE